MTKKNFIEFAKQIHAGLANGGMAEGAAEARRDAISRCDLVCRVARQFNPRFDEARFRQACGL
jgi:hypothetical protein